jgi:mannose-6-phosphate isomerase
MSAELNLPQSGDKQTIFNATKSFLGELSINVASVDDERPWGGFFVIDEADTDRFIDQFFPGYDVEKIKKYGSKLMPKLLVVGPGEELSWQYHHRRAELWRCVEGPVGYTRSKDDSQGEIHPLAPSESVQFDPQERHSLKGLDNWGVVAEFWQHTDPTNPSTEADIIRLSDKYGR